MVERSECSTPSISSNPRTSSAGNQIPTVLPVFISSIPARVAMLPTPPAGIAARPGWHLGLWSPRPAGRGVLAELLAARHQEAKCSAPATAAAFRASLPSTIGRNPRTLDSAKDSDWPGTVLDRFSRRCMSSCSSAVKRAIVNQPSSKATSNCSTSLARTALPGSIVSILTVGPISTSPWRSLTAARRWSFARPINGEASATILGLHRGTAPIRVPR